MSDSYATPVGTSTAWPFDYFHVNSLAPQADGTTLISARNTSAMYELDTATEQILEGIGGRSSSIRLAPGASTAYQHDARELPNGTISVFDNGGVPMVHEQSRGMILELDPRTGTDAVVAQYKHSTPLSSGSQGNLQLLPDGNAFIGWGSEPYFSEFNSAGQTIFDAHFRGPYQSYRGYRFSWVGAPAEPPAIAAVRSAHTGLVTVYASWNGDTRATRWRLLAGDSPRALAPIAEAPREGFETAIALPAPASFVAVQALYLMALRFAGATGEGNVTSLSYAYLLAATFVTATAFSLSLISAAPLTRRGLDADTASEHVIHSGWVSLALVGAGAGIVMDSHPASEYEETRDKAKALLRALELAQAGL